MNKSEMRKNKCHFRVRNIHIHIMSHAIAMKLGGLLRTYGQSNFGPENNKPFGNYVWVLYISKRSQKHMPKQNHAAGVTYLRCERGVSVKKRVRGSVI